MISLRVCLPSMFNRTHLLVEIYLKTIAALSKQISITTDLMVFSQKSAEAFSYMMQGRVIRRSHI